MSNDLLAMVGVPLAGGDAVPQEPTECQVAAALAEYDLSLQSDPRNTEQGRDNPKWVGAMRRDAMREALRAGLAVPAAVAEKPSEPVKLRNVCQKSAQSAPASTPIAPSTDVTVLSKRQSALTNAFIESYQFDDGESAVHAPSEHESMLIADAIHGLLADEEWADAYYAWDLARRAARALQASAGPADSSPGIADTPHRVADLKIALDFARRACADGRRAGRAEAFALLTNTSAEDFPEDFIGESVGGGTGELMFHWDTDKLLELFDLESTDSTLSLIDRISGAWWDQEHTIDELRLRIKSGPREITTLDEFFAEAKLLDMRASDLAPKLALRPEFAAEVAAAERAADERDEQE